MAEQTQGVVPRRTLSASEARLRRITWSPNGQLLASAADDGNVHIWRESEGVCEHEIKAHESLAYGLAFSPDSRVLASSGEDGLVRLWDTSTGERVPSGILHQTASWCVAYSPTGQLIATACDDGSVQIWRVGNRTEGRFVRSFHHIVEAWAVTFSNDGKYLVSGSADHTVRIWRVSDGASVKTMRGHTAGVLTVAISPDGRLIASASDDATARIWEFSSGRCTMVLEGHTRDVTAAYFSYDGRLLATKSLDSRVMLWRSDTWETVSEFTEPMSSKWRPALAFHPSLPILATLGQGDQSISTWDVNIDELFGVSSTTDIHGWDFADVTDMVDDHHGHGTHMARVIAAIGQTRTIHYTSAKIVLVGESNVGKSCLAMRLADNRYPEDHEHGTTHGMRFWPMEAEELHASAKPPEGQRRDVVLWDFGGQDEYQLVHQMFLHDTTLALVLIDPTRGDVEFNRAREWNKRLEKQLGERRAVKLLVGAQVDDDKKSGLINRGAIERLCEECGFAGFYETSALSGREIEGFRDALAGAVDWENLAKTSRPELFQRIRDEIELMREAGDVVVLIADLETSVRENRSLAEPPKNPASRRLWEFWKRKVTDDDAATTLQAVPFDDAAFGAVTDQLATQGVVVKTTLTGGDDAVVLQLPVIERYAASLIVAARDNPRGVPALETSELGAPSISLPGMTSEDRVPRGQERIVLEAVVELMIEHGLCFRHEGLLVFPTLLRATETDRADELPGSVSLYYDFSGAIDNVYASLISWLVIGQGFGRIRLWENRVEFEAEGQGACGLRKVSRGGGFAHLDVYFHDGTPTQTQTEFISFVHGHLRSSGIDVVEHFELICGNTDCRYEFPRVVVQNRMAKGETDVVCPQCETRIKLSEGFQREQEREQERERDEQAERKSFALMTRVREDVPKIVASVKQRAFGRTDDQYRTDRPLRVLHLSDLHFTSDAVPETKLQWLDDDIRKGKWLDGGELDYVVISGDMTHQGSAAGFRQASEFASLLVERFQLTAERFVLVPGNHDVQDMDAAYRLRMKPVGDERQRAVELKEQGVFLVPHPEMYPQRLKEFSDQFYHPLLQKPYPLDPARQGVAYIFPETKLQFLTLNSCWEIDQFHRTRASVHPDAVARLIAEADRQIERAIANTAVKPEEYLRIGVWHHPVADVERGILNREFLGNLQTGRVRVCLTGDVHEMRRELIDYWHDNRMHVLGAGSFGAKGPDLSEGSPRLYNLLEIDRDFSKIRVHTRQQPKPNGAWKGWNEWPMPDGGEGGLPYFDIPLK